jgi:hypothetical protein
LIKKLQPRLRNKWLPAETWFEAMKRFNVIDEELTFNLRSFNIAMARSKSELNWLMIERFGGTHTTGVFRVTFQKQKYYYVTNQNAQVSHPNPLEGRCTCLPIPFFCSCLSTQLSLLLSRCPTEEKDNPCAMIDFYAGYPTSVITLIQR